MSTKHFEIFRLASGEGDLSRGHSTGDTIFVGLGAREESTPEAMAKVYPWSPGIYLVRLKQTPNDGPVVFSVNADKKLSMRTGANAAAAFKLPEDSA